LYDGPTHEAALPVDVFAQTLRRYALRDQGLRAKFDEHVDAAGTYVPAWLSPEVRKQKSQESFDAAMRVAREQGFAHAAPLFEGVRGDSFAAAQVAIAVYEMRELGDHESALRRLNEVVRVAPRNVAARMQRANLFAKDSIRKVEAANDWLHVLRELVREASTTEASHEVAQAAMEGLWGLHREYADARELEAALDLVNQDVDRGFEALSRYVHTHPCAWDAQAHLASIALSRQKFELTSKLLVQVRWLFPDDPNPHFVYAQALASKGNLEAALTALEHASRLAPDDADIAKWLAFTRQRLLAEHQGPSTQSVDLARQVARSLLVLLGMVRYGRVFAAALVLHKLPGDVALTFVVQAVAQQEQRRFASFEGTMTTDGDIDVRLASERTVLIDWEGEALSHDMTVGDIKDPGVVCAIVYDPASRAEGAPEPAECCAMLLDLVRADHDLAGKLERHMSSADATLKHRLDLEG
jgi:hypothetical protein